MSKLKTNPDALGATAAAGGGAAGAGAAGEGAAGAMAVGAEGVGAGGVRVSVAAGAAGKGGGEGGVGPGTGAGGEAGAGAGAGVRTLGGILRVGVLGPVGLSFLGGNCGDTGEPVSAGAAGPVGGASETSGCVWAPNEEVIPE